MTRRTASEATLTPAARGISASGKTISRMATDGKLIQTAPATKAPILRVKGTARAASRGPMGAHTRANLCTTVSRATVSFKTRLCDHSDASWFLTHLYPYAMLQVSIIGQTVASIKAIGLTTEWTGMVSYGFLMVAVTKVITLLIKKKVRVRSTGQMAGSMRVVG